MNFAVDKVMLAVFLVMTLFSCSKKDDPTPAPAGNGAVKLEFFNYVGSSTLNMNNQWYQNAHGDSFEVSKFNYYISNIKLNGAGNTYAESESYHLLQQSDPTSMSFNVAGVPQGSYTGITFTIGVDSLRNVSGAQTGALDPVNGMFWSWNTGYIMLKFEGNSPKSNQANGYLEFHAGGFSGPNSVVRTVTLNFPTPINVTTSTTINHVHLTADVLALFKSPNLIDFSVMPLMNTAGDNAKKIADNYANMFTISYAGL